jgi:hypothetical protein
VAFTSSLERYCILFSTFHLKMVIRPKHVAVTE